MPVLENEDSGKVLVGKAARSAKSGRQGERTDADVLDYIYQALQSRPKLKAAQLHREMEADDRWRPLLPELRAFRGHVATTRQQIDHGRWSPVDADDEEARLVLPVLGRLNAVQEAQLAKRGWEPWPPVQVTPRVAKWIARLRRWLPDQEGAGDYMEPALLYAAREAREAPTDDLDEIVAKIAGRSWPSKEEGK
jgi:hypothetical protein